MKCRGMGISLQSNDTVSDMDRLKAKLDKLLEHGFDAVEIPIQGLGVIRNGLLNERRLETYRKLFQNVPLHVTTHAPFDLNVFRHGNGDTELKLLMASVEASGAIGAQTIVYHVGRYIGEEQFLYPQYWSHYDEPAKKELLRQEREWLRLAGDRAAQLKLKIAMENMRPYLDCPEYCYSVIPRLLAAQVASIGHPQIGVALDVGHLYLSTGMYGLDLEQEVRLLLPHIIHLHVHDNFGKPSFSTEKNQYELIPLGRGDLHAPIGTGDVPMAEIMALLGGSFDGFLIHEVRGQYEKDWPSLAEWGRGAAREADAHPVGRTSVG
ncbi:MAG: sugar phosphate isomerase/epimerase [Paenibacillus sp.]|nr:sugar phosphate isomerase/epimerase [Paenibacillus sp.]